MTRTAELPMPVQNETFTNVSERLSWRAKIGRAAGRIMLAGALAGGASALALEEAQPAAASSVSCYGDYCSGQYANQTGCDRDAVTLTSADVTQEDYEMGLPFIINPAGPVKVGTVELRYSPSCKTKWARLSTYVRNGVDNVSVTQDTGYTQTRHVGGWGTGSPAAISDSPMIYSPGDAVHAYVSGGSGDLINTSTDWR